MASRERKNDAGTDSGGVASDWNHPVLKVCHCVQFFVSLLVRKLYVTVLRFGITIILK